MSEPSAVVVILTALDLEFNAVVSFLHDPSQVVHPHGTIYTDGHFSGESIWWRVIVVEAGMGNPVAAIETSRAIAHFRPNAVLFVGVAGGAKDVQLCDVVIADHIYGYEPCKVGEVVLPRMKTLSSSYALVQQARAARRSDSWHKRLATGCTPRAFVGPIASGEQVIASNSSDTFAMIRRNCDDALAVEMEGWGFLSAAHANGAIPAIVIRGISDLIDDKDPELDIESQPLAAHHAAAFAFEMLARFRPTGLGKK